MTQRLFASQRERWEGSTAIQHSWCPWCGTALDQLTEWIEIPLIAHAGYGEATRHQTRSCRCQLTSISSTDSVNPRPYRP